MEIDLEENAKKFLSFLKCLADFSQKEKTALIDHGIFYYNFINKTTEFYKKKNRFSFRQKNKRHRQICGFHSNRTGTGQRQQNVQKDDQIFGHHDRS